MKTHIALVVTLCSFSAPARAAVVLDQSAVNLIGSGQVASVARVGEFLQGSNVVTGTAVQTMTAGVSGKLSHLEFQATNGAPQGGWVRMLLIDGDYGAGAGEVVATGYSRVNQIPGAYEVYGGAMGLRFDVSDANYFVSPGQRYSVVFQGFSFAEGQSASLVIGVAPFPPVDGMTPVGPGYAGGDFYAFADGQPIPFRSDFDVGFRSYVDTGTAVPEPATWAMLVAGFGMMGATVRRRRVRAASANYI